MAVTDVQQKKPDSFVEVNTYSQPKKRTIERRHKQEKPFIWGA